MLQKINSVPARGAVFFVLTAFLLLQKPTIGDIAQNPRNLTSLEVYDPSSEALFAESIESLKPIPQKEEVKKPAIKISSQTVYKSQTPTEIEVLIRKYSEEYGANAEIMIAIAKCESGLNASAVSPSGAYNGLYQFLLSTWQSNRRAMGLSEDSALMFNAEEAIKTAAFKMGRDGYGAWPACYRKTQISFKNT